MTGDGWYAISVWLHLGDIRLVHSRRSARRSCLDGSSEATTTMSTRIRSTSIPMSRPLHCTKAVMRKTSRDENGKGRMRLYMVFLERRFITNRSQLAMHLPISTWPEPPASVEKQSTFFTQLMVRTSDRRLETYCLSQQQPHFSTVRSWLAMLPDDSSRPESPTQFGQITLRQRGIRAPRKPLSGLRSH